MTNFLKIESMEGTRELLVNIKVTITSRKMNPH